MSYAAIMVHAECDPKTEPRLQLAAGLANDFDAALIGVAAEIFEPPGYGAAFANVDGELLTAEAKAVEEDLRLAETKFRSAAAAVRGAVEWRAGVALPCEMLAHQSRAADLIVIGPKQKETYAFHNRCDPGDLLMQAGRPLLLAPLDLARLDASSIVVGWKDSRESRRALADAMPFLKRARQVLIAEVCEDRDEASARIRVQDVADGLARHGVKASTTVRMRDEATVAEALLEIADMQDAGLVVTGGYGHARLREWVFGGVTLELLEGSHKAVLLSH